MKFIRGIILICIVLFVGTFVNAYGIEKEKDFKILIDPGHGGCDGGAKSKSGTVEKNLNLQISLKLRDTLKNIGYKVFMTREDDSNLSNIKKEDLYLRCQMKKESECDIFISIHQNSFSNAKSKGTQVWYASNENSKRLAESIQLSVKEGLQTSNHRIAKDAKRAYSILRDGHEGASIIVECGFLSNYDDEQNLISDEYQNRLVEEIANGIKKYFEEEVKKPILSKNSIFPRKLGTNVEN